LIRSNSSVHAESISGELTGVTAVAAAPTFEAGALAIAWDGQSRDSEHPPVIPVYDFRSSGAVARLQTLIADTEPAAFSSLLAQQEFLSAINEYWNSIGAGPTEQFRGIRADKPGQDLVSTRHESEHRIGLHLDNWHRYPARTRELSPRRLTLNLGPGSRWLILIDTHDFWREICNRGDGDKLVGTLQLRTWRLALGRPVYRYHVPPGFAYLAATEYYGHDGSTRWAVAPSLTIHWTNVTTEGR
jgi:hypothetical protein